MHLSCSLYTCECLYVNNFDFPFIKKSIDKQTLPEIIMLFYRKFVLVLNWIFFKGLSYGNRAIIPFSTKYPDQIIPGKKKVRGIFLTTRVFWSEPNQNPIFRERFIPEEIGYGSGRNIMTQNPSKLKHLSESGFFSWLSIWVN